ncbi:LysR family transcriptional regulator [Spirosoma sp. KCTC 42546]|uniref:LysR substrate-binding domain-containing protein n=1 Tax=Spirosoma sp. KCTC 42546 TaxID=2520506 RepID=UPI00115995F8|nr:LysR substrate-binding domain-containing protein [Spirosoma sp. KCTC 42546]QDK77195.1 LysR family transcriptional regulator [Spirosoma sp. KCTC 42546]
MELRRLRYYVAVAEELHFGRAAHKLSVSQPALSQQIQLLEAEVGVELFLREKRRLLRKVELTKAGSFFLQEARKILQASEKAIEATRKIGLTQKEIKLGTYRMMIRSRILDILTVCSQRFPDIDLKIIEFPTHLAVQDALMDGQLDLGVTLLPFHYNQLDGIALKPGYLKVMLARNHPLAHKDILTVDQLRDEKWVDINRAIHTVYDDIERMCKKAGFSREGAIVQEVSSIELLSGLVSLGIGIAVVPTFFDTSAIPGVVCKDLVNADGSPLTEVVINAAICYKLSNLSPTLQALANAFKTQS